MEASADLIDALKIELDEFRTAVNSFGLKPLPGETSEMASMQLSTATKSVASTIEVNFGSIKAFQEIFILPLVALVVPIFPQFF